MIQKSAKSAKKLGSRQGARAREMNSELLSAIRDLKESKRHLFVVDSLDKHMQNEKELIRLRRFMPAARTTLHQGGLNFACGANYPHQALKGGYFVFVWRVGT